MTQNPEDELLDESLRETFSDFTLSPSSQLWAGVEGQLAGLPKTPRTLPYNVLLPLVGLVGIGVGWLLPHPESAKPTPKTEQPALSRAAVSSATPPLAPAAALLSASAPAGPAAGREQAAAKPAKRVAVRRQRPAVVAGSGIAAAPAPATATPVQATATTPRAALPPASEALPAAVLPAVAATPADAQQAATASQLQPYAPQETEQPSAAGAGTATEMATASVPKPGEAPRERRTEYRVPTHRMAEKGRGFRRRLTHLTQQVRHVFSPRRSRAAAQPDF